ncbi:hypothetical protein NQ318_010585 [Aromia moschata]|uniref:DNA-directed DNA polymerase n=1 Tax=Aromia moschata TaxID=1265417 RepID=A0AAV8XB02_9CUCU|nr:hypothetical protein NQ318_010585 [Aromia moschata]
MAELWAHPYPLEGSNGLIQTSILQHYLMIRQSDISWKTFYSTWFKRCWLATLHTKKRYVIHYRNLKYALSYGILKKIFKLMNNAVFGKTMENIEKRSIVKLVMRWDDRYGAEALI